MLCNDTYRTYVIVMLFVSVEKIKRDLDRTFGCPWQVIAGEAFSFSIDYEQKYLYYLLYGPIAILAYKVRR